MALPLYPAQQLLRGIAAPLAVTLTDSDGEPAPGLSGVTVTITTAGGVALRTNAAASDVNDGAYAVNMTAAELEDLNWLTAVWKVNGVTRATTTHEVVGGIYASLDAIRRWDENIAALGDDDKVRRTRATVEQAFEAMTGCAFVPRYYRDVLHGSNLPEQLLTFPLVRRIRSVTFRTSSTSSVTLTDPELAALTVDRDGILRYLNSQGVTGTRGASGRFPVGQSNVIVEYEHGLDQPPNEIVDCGIAYLRERLQHVRNAIPDRAISYTVTAGGTYRLATPDGWTTGNPDIDAVLERHAWPRVGIA